MTWSLRWRRKQAISSSLSINTTCNSVRIHHWVLHVTDVCSCLSFIGRPTAVLRFVDSQITWRWRRRVIWHWCLTNQWEPARSAVPGFRLDSARRMHITDDRRNICTVFRCSPNGGLGADITWWIISSETSHVNGSNFVFVIWKKIIRTIDQTITSVIWGPQNGSLLFPKRPNATSTSLSSIFWTKQYDITYLMFIHGCVHKLLCLP